MESSLLAVERQLSRLNHSPSEIHDRLLYGLRGALEALDSMATYLEVEDPDILNRGWMALLEATVDIQDSTRELALN